MASRIAVLLTTMGVGTTSMIAQNLPKISIGDLTLPVTNPVIVQVMKERRFDVKHGFVLEPRAYPSITAFYAGLATGEVDSLIAGTTMIAKLRLEGASVRLSATVLRMSHNESSPSWAHCLLWCRDTLTLPFRS